MLKIDYLNNNYSVDEIINAYTEGSIDNFKGDEDFVIFLISFAIGNFVAGPDAEDFKEYAKYDGVLNVMLLDEYGYLGSKLYKLYEICDKNKITFINFCHLLGRYGVTSTFDKVLVDCNLKLTKPVPFIDEEIVLSTGTKPQLNPEEWLVGRDLRFEERREYEYELNRSLRHRINESIKENHDDIELFPELPSYIEKERREQEQRIAKRVSDEHLININNLFFGSFIFGTGGGVLNLGLKAISWFENTNTDMFGYHIFRSVPDGDYTLLDDNDMVHLPEKVLKSDGVEVGPNTPVRKVNIANVPTILDAAIKKLEEEHPIEFEQELAMLKHVFEDLENRENISVKNLEALGIIRIAYEIAYGEIFKKHNGEELDENPDSVSRG